MAVVVMTSLCSRRDQTFPNADRAMFNSSVLAVGVVPLRDVVSPARNSWCHFGACVVAGVAQQCYLGHYGNDKSDFVG